MRFRFSSFLLVSLMMLPVYGEVGSKQDGSKQDGSKQAGTPKRTEGTIRVATYNVSLHRKESGELVRNLEKGDEQAKEIASIIRAIQPDVLLVNEIDYDEEKKGAALFQDRYLNAGDKKEKLFPYAFTGPVNTGVPSGLDLNQNGKTGESDDGWGYGAYPGQYGMAVYSRFPIDASKVRSFQKLKWSSVPSAKRPMKKDGSSFYPDAIWNQLVLSSKSHWDVPIDVEGRTLHLLASHPTPPVFDGDEDRNGCRNHDEIRLWIDYLTGGDAASYLTDDQGAHGGLKQGEGFVICGDLNSDIEDGASIKAAIDKLLNHPRVVSKPIPESDGAEAANKAQAGANKSHRSNPRYDTADFNDKSSGNLRCDYVLPSSEFEIVQSGVHWPASSEGKEPSDHHLVWVDMKWKKN